MEFPLFAYGAKLDLQGLFTLVIGVPNCILVFQGFRIASNQEVRLHMVPYCILKGFFTLVVGVPYCILVFQGFHIAHCEQPESLVAWGAIYIWIF